MDYRITHSTTYTYSEPAAICQNQVLLTPRAAGRVLCRSHRLVVKPPPTTSSRREDYFGNLIHVFSIEENHSSLSITATSRVRVMPQLLPDADQSPPWEDVAAVVLNRTAENWLECVEYCFDSPRIMRNAAFEKYARQSFTPGRSVYPALLDLTRRIHADFKYDPTATSVHTRPEESFQLKKGVCQDFAQVQIGCLRAIGIPARYVSGYLRTLPPPGKPRLVGADASHAWLSVWCGPHGWIDVDPTNNVPCSTDHIPIAWGRDYEDVAPVRGVFLGGGAHTLSVSVDVCPLSPEEALLPLEHDEAREQLSPPST